MSACPTFSIKMLTPSKQCPCQLLHCLPQSPQHCALFSGQIMITQRCSDKAQAMSTLGLCWESTLDPELGLGWREGFSGTFAYHESTGFCFPSYLQRCFQPRERQSSINIYSPDTALCQTWQDALYQPLNLVYVSGGSQTRKISPIHQFPLLLLSGKTTLSSKVRVFGDHFLGISKVEGC